MPSPSPVLNITPQSQTRLFPSTPSSNATTVPLSILDNSVLRFAPSAAVWLFSSAAPPDYLKTALQTILNSYPQWTGQLDWDHTQPQFGRLQLTWGTPQDPGAEFIVASSPCTLPSSIPAHELLSSTRLPLHNLQDAAGQPALQIQLTYFSCGGLAVGVRLSHSLADAQSLVQFVHNWAAVSRSSTPILPPLFDPQLLDAAATTDGGIVTLPVRRYDWWASSSNCPPHFLSATQPPAGVDPGPRGTPMPWHEWDLTAPVSRGVLHFSGAELKRMRIGAGEVTHHDALLAHVWGLINRARGIGDDEEVYMNVTLGVRRRLKPGLPATFVGSPIINAYVSTRGGLELARRIRETINRCDHGTLPALLHEMGNTQALYRIWQAFLGRRNIIVTSWVHLGVHEVDFGFGRAEYVEGVMPKGMDGCVQIMEARPRGEGKKRHWYEDGLDVAVYLRTEVLEGLMKDPELRKYRCEED